MKNKIIFFTLLTISLPQITITKADSSMTAITAFFTWESFKSLKLLEPKQQLVFFVVLSAVLGSFTYYWKTINKHETKEEPIQPTSPSNSDSLIEDFKAIYEKTSQRLYSLEHRITDLHNTFRTKITPAIDELSTQLLEKKYKKKNNNSSVTSTYTQDITPLAQNLAPNNIGYNPNKMLTI